MFALAFKHNLTNNIFKILKFNNKVIISNNNKIVDNSTTLTSIFNLKAKLKTLKNSVYFSSKNLIQVKGY